jgi:hypothetical protein
VRKILKRIAFYSMSATLIVTIGCSQQELSSPSSPLASPESESPLPTPSPDESPTEKPGPSQTSAAPGDLVFPTSQPGLATVTGTLRRRGSDKGFQGMGLFLSEVIETSDPDFPMVGVNKSSDPEAMLDANTGAFAFYDVPPGKYALAITRPLLVPVLVDDAEEGGTLFVTLETDESLDLGTLPVTIPE